MNPPSEKDRVLIEEDSTRDLNPAEHFVAAASGGLIGKTFAERYEIIDKLGEGGVGTVYKVRHLHLDTIHALKILQSKQLKDQDSIARFCREAKVISKLQHPNIVRIQDFGVYDGCPFMIMDYIEGKPISTLIAESTATHEVWVSIFKQVLDALGHAHQRNIVHRDIKPANILYSLDEAGEPLVTVVDFGLAKFMDENSAQKAADGVTKTGDLFGTPLYMSPEQCTGHAIDARSDIYSMGCVMYYCLTGLPPFSAQSSFELVYKQIHCSPTPFPPGRTPVIAALESIVFKAMAKEKSARYQYAQQMSADLMQVTDAKYKASVLAKAKLIAARINASERVSVVRKACLHVAMVNALVTSFLLLTMPGQMRQEMESMKQYATIIQTLDALGGGRITPQKEQKHDTTLEELFQLTRNTSLSKLADKHRRKVYANMEDDKRRELQALKSLESFPFDFESIRRKGRQMLEEGIQNWLECARMANAMSREALTIYLHNHDSLLFHCSIYAWLPWYGLVSLAALIVLTFQSLLKSMQIRKVTKYGADPAMFIASDPDLKLAVQKP